MATSNHKEAPVISSYKPLRPTLYSRSEELLTRGSPRRYAHVYSRRFSEETEEFAYEWDYNDDTASWTGSHQMDRENAHEMHLQEIRTTRPFTSTYHNQSIPPKTFSDPQVSLFNFLLAPTF